MSEMTSELLAMPDGWQLRLYGWQPAATPRAIVQIAHGMGEHARRYDPVARHLTDHGFAVYANDHRGHGESLSDGRKGWLGENGWSNCVDDLLRIGMTLRSRHPGLPLVLLGHSMGAMLSQRFVTLHGQQIDALVLSGSPGASAGSRWLPSLIARLIVAFKGREHDSPMLQGMIFGRANDPFGEAGGFEWLSRDATEVQRYVEDPDCGFVLRAGSLLEMFGSLGDTENRIPAIPTSLPVYVLSGTDDPVHGEMAGLARLLQLWGAHGVGIDARLYPGGRHEMFNETNRDQVLAELTAWLDRTLA